MIFNTNTRRFLRPCKLIVKTQRVCIHLRETEKEKEKISLLITRLPDLAFCGKQLSAF